MLKPVAKPKAAPIGISLALWNSVFSVRFLPRTGYAVPVTIGPGYKKGKTEP